MDGDDAAFETISFLVFESYSVDGAAGTTTNARVLVRHRLPSDVSGVCFAVAKTAAEIRW